MQRAGYFERSSITGRVLNILLFFVWPAYLPEYAVALSAWIGIHT
jgi:hypothetical protein